MSITLVSSLLLLFLSSALAKTSPVACSSYTTFFPLSTYSPAVSYCTNDCRDVVQTVTSTSTVVNLPPTIFETITTGTLTSFTAVSTQTITSFTSTITSELDVTSIISLTAAPITTTTTISITSIAFSTVTVTSQSPQKRAELPEYTASDCSIIPGSCTTYVVTTLLPRITTLATTSTPCTRDIKTSAISSSQEGLSSTAKKDGSSLPGYSRISGSSMTSIEHLVSSSPPNQSRGSLMTTAYHSTTCTKTVCSITAAITTYAAESISPDIYYSVTSKSSFTACSGKPRHSQSKSKSGIRLSSGTAQSSARVSSTVVVSPTGMASSSTRISSSATSSATSSSAAVDTLPPLLSFLQAQPQAIQTVACACIGGALPSCTTSTFTATTTTTMIAEGPAEISSMSVEATLVSSFTATSTILTDTTTISTSQVTVPGYITPTSTATSTKTLTTTSVTTTTILAVSSASSSAAPSPTCQSGGTCAGKSLEGYMVLCDTAIFPSPNDYALIATDSATTAIDCLADCGARVDCEAYMFTPQGVCTFYSTSPGDQKDGSHSSVFLTYTAAGYTSGTYLSSCGH